MLLMAVRGQLSEELRRASDQEPDATTAIITRRRALPSRTRTFPEMRQSSVEVVPTRTMFRLRDPKVRVELNVPLLSSLFARDYARLSRPVSYVVHDARSLTTQEHSLELYFDACAEHAVNEMSEEVAWADFRPAQ